MNKKLVPDTNDFEPAKISRQKRALIMIASHAATGETLTNVMESRRDEIHWDNLGYGVLSGGQKTAVSWAWD